MNKQIDWQEYERRKAEIQKQNLSSGSEKSATEGAHRQTRLRHQDKTGADGPVSAARSRQKQSHGGALDPKLTEARTRKTLTEAQRLELKLEHEKGELMPRADVRKAAYDLVGAMYKRFMKYPREAKRRMKLTREDVRMMESDFNLIFQDLKQDCVSIL